jgi:hypothetical protein
MHIGKLLYMYMYNGFVMIHHHTQTYMYHHNLSRPSYVFSIAKSLWQPLTSHKTWEGLGTCTNVNIQDILADFQ